MTQPLKSWIENDSPHPDVVSEGFCADIFALDLGPPADGNKNILAVLIPQAVPLALRLSSFSYQLLTLPEFQKP